MTRLTQGLPIPQSAGNPEFHANLHARNFKPLTPHRLHRLHRLYRPLLPPVLRVLHPNPIASEGRVFRRAEGPGSGRPVHQRLRAMDRTESQGWAVWRLESGPSWMDMDGPNWANLSPKSTSKHHGPSEKKETSYHVTDVVSMQRLMCGDLPQATELQMVLVVVGHVPVKTCTTVPECMRL